MPARSPELRTALARAGHAAAYGTTEKVEQTRRELAAERLAAYIEKVVDASPPLTADQQDRLTLLLRPTSDGAAA